MLSKQWTLRYFLTCLLWEIPIFLLSSSNCIYRFQAYKLKIFIYKYLQRIFESVAKIINTATILIVTFTCAGSFLKYIHFQNLIFLKPSIVIQKARGSGVQGYLLLSSKFEANLDNMRPLNKMQTKTNPLYLKKQAMSREQNSKSYTAQHILHESTSDWSAAEEASPKTSS